VQVPPPAAAASSAPVAGLDTSVTITQQAVPGVTPEASIPAALPATAGDKALTATIVDDKPTLVASGSS
jgi:hypothetical protein